MQIEYSLSSEHVSSPLVLTIGNFDGVHLGHQTILKHVVDQAKKRKSPSAVITFINHPTTILRPDLPTPRLCTAAHKVLLLKKAHIDHLFLLSFSKEFSHQSAEEFLNQLKDKLPFNLLILGNDATIGKEKKGDRKAVTSISKKLGFEIEYLPDCKIEQERVSSSRIRNLIQGGNLQEASKFLGRPFSIFSTVVKGAGRGKELGIHTANIPVLGLCLPPFGVYAVTLVHKDKAYPGVANLGLAPTVRKDESPILEVHLFDKKVDLYGEAVEVIFHEFIRPEHRFHNLIELKKQIDRDIIQAKEIHKGQ